MRKVRIGNDIAIEWRIYRYGDEEQLDDKEVTVKLLDQSMRPVGFTYEVSGNLVKGVFEGRNQNHLGMYTLLLVENNGKTAMTTIDECRFVELVPRSFMEGGADEHGVSITTVQLTSDISVPSNGIDGKSAYEVAVKNGYVGTEEEWLTSLVGKSAYEEAKLAGYCGTEKAFGKQLYEQVITSKEFEEGAIEIDDPTEDSNAVKYIEQELTVAQQGIARDNINAFSNDEATICEDVDIEVYATDPSVVSEAVRWSPQVLSSGNKEQARTNIGAASELELCNEDTSVGDKGRVVVLEEKMAFIEAQTNAVVGDMTLLETTAKDYVVNSINEVYDRSGLDTTLATTAQTTNAAVNEVLDKVPEVLEESDDINMALEVFS